MGELYQSWGLNEELKGATDIGGLKWVMSMKIHVSNGTEKKTMKKERTKLSWHVNEYNKVEIKRHQHVTGVETRVRHRV